MATAAQLRITNPTLYAHGPTAAEVLESVRRAIIDAYCSPFYVRVQDEVTGEHRMIENVDPWDHAGKLIDEAFSHPQAAAKLTYFGIHRDMEIAAVFARLPEGV